MTPLMIGILGCLALLLLLISSAVCRAICAGVEYREANAPALTKACEKPIRGRL